jgi:sugar transferase (PEP-CTERM system associated)
VRRTILFPVETLLLLAAGLLAACLRLQADAYWELAHRRGWLKLLLVTAVVQVSFYLFDLYDRDYLFRPRRMLGSIGAALFGATLVLMILFYWFPTLLLGRGVFFISLLAGGCAIALSRLALAYATGQSELSSNERVLILGSGPHAVEVARATLERPRSGFKIVGFVDDKPELLGKSLINPSVIGLTSDLNSIVTGNQIDRIVVAVEDRRGKFPTDELLTLRLSGRVSVEESASYYEKLTGKVGTGIVRPSWLIFSRGARSTQIARRARRLINALLAVTGLIASLPLMLLVAIAVRLESRGPVFYLQERVGKNGRRFKIFKFRSMRADAEDESGPVWAEHRDPRITRVGRIIRKLRFDELPQFVNIVRGDMNFVGPRPERPEFVEKLSEIAPYYARRHLIKPGLTGWAQVRYPYGASVHDSIQKLEYDLYYIKNRSLLLDAAIVFDTVRIVLFGRGGR